MTGPGGRVVVWGNCQAEPVAVLLRTALAPLGWRVEPVAPVFLADAAEVERVRTLVRGADVLISQPIGDDYGLPGSSTAALAELLPVGARLLRFPVAFHVGPFPYQVNAHGADGVRVLAPLTDYHDLRAVAAAERGLDLASALDQWPEPTPDVVRQISAGSVAELHRREAGLDVVASTAVLDPGAMMTISHPANALLADVADQLLAALGVAAAVTVPAREFLGARRAPVEPAVAHALGWPSSAVRSRWRVDGRDLAPEQVLGAHLAFYRDRPDVVVDCRQRYATRLAVFGL